MKKLLVVLLVLVSMVLFAEEKKLFGIEAENFSLDNSEEGKIAAKWSIPQNDEIDKIEILFKYNGEGNFKRYKLLDKSIVSTYIEKLEPLALITVKIKLWSKSGEKSKGKEIAINVKHGSVIYDEIDGRKMVVYLPEGYGNLDERYPVMYMLDGQNIFSKAFAADEWKVDEVVDRLTKEGKINRVIVVGIFNGVDKRGEEYIPYRGLSNHHEFIVKSIIPYIDGKYRTKTEKQYRGIMGSSLGGLMTMYMLKNYPDYFGFGGAVSTHDPWKTGLVDEFEKSDTKIWIDTGTGEYAGGLYSYTNTARKMTVTLEDKGYEYGKNLFYLEAKGAIHREYYWAERVENPFIIFAGKYSDKVVDFTVDWETICKTGIKSFYGVVSATAKYDNGLSYTLMDKAKYSIDKGSIDKYGKIDLKDEKEAEVTVSYNGIEKKIKVSAKEIEERGEMLIK